ncbi:MAG: Purine catabolism protein PucB [Candidatus Heimdallarchaeota archaeon LC_2]|nr:MAG: Purine catabolism protein PucB [Candidatus Heimdallarchaeota archaeon LC_2]
MISALLLAAGESRRMGDSNKLTLTLGTKLLIEKTTETLIDSDASEIIVVIGHEEDKISKILEKYTTLKIIVNKNYRKGMTTSIQHGIKFTSKNSTGYMICLADMPLIETEEINVLIQSFQSSVTKNPKTIMIPVFNKKSGNPVIFSAQYRDEILAHKELNGCKGIVKRNNLHVKRVNMKTNHFIVDIDTMEEYRDILSKNSP